MITSPRYGLIWKRLLRVKLRQRFQECDLPCFIHINAGKRRPKATARKRLRHLGARSLWRIKMPRRKHPVALRRFGHEAPIGLFQISYVTP